MQISLVIHSQHFQDVQEITELSNGKLVVKWREYPRSKTEQSF